HIETVALRAAQLYIEHCKVEFWLAVKALESFSCRGHTCHVRCARAFQDLLNVEGDQEFVVQHKTPLAAQQAIRPWQGHCLQDGTFPCPTNLIGQHLKMT